MLSFKNTFAGDSNLKMVAKIFDANNYGSVSRTIFSFFCLLQNDILYQMLNSGFGNFKFIVILRMYFLLVATFFLELWLSVSDDICILNIFYEVLTFNI